jgi:hypothetical protein
MLGEIGLQKSNLSGLAGAVTAFESDETNHERASGTAGESRPVAARVAGIA